MPSLSACGIGFPCCYCREPSAGRARACFEGQDGASQWPWSRVMATNSTMLTSGLSGLSGLLRDGRSGLTWFKRRLVNCFGAGDGRGGARSAARPSPPAGSCALLSCPRFGQGVCRYGRAGRERDSAARADRRRIVAGACRPGVDIMRLCQAEGAGADRVA